MYTTVAVSSGIIVAIIAIGLMIIHTLYHQTFGSMFHCFLLGVAVGMTLTGLIPLLFAKYVIN